LGCANAPTVTVRVAVFFSASSSSAKGLPTIMLRRDHNVGAIDLDVAFQKNNVHAKVACTAQKRSRPRVRSLATFVRVKSVHVLPRSSARTIAASSICSGGGD